LKEPFYGRRTAPPIDFAPLRVLQKTKGE